MKPVAIVGAGISGLAAATAVSARGLPVLLCEQRPFPGGRAYSFRDATTGETIDNGQHLLIAGYAHTMHFLRRIGADALLNVQRRPSLMFHHPVRGFRALRLPHLPPPLHLLWGILTGGPCAPAERADLVRAGIALRRCTGRREDEIATWTVTGWLDALRQPAEARRSLWEPLAVSIMNEHCDAASALLFVRSLRAAFLGRWNNAALALPRVGLSELFVDPAVRFITEHGGAVRCSTDVTAIECGGGHASAVTLRDGSSIACDAVILAVPPPQAVQLLPANSLTGAARDAWLHASPSPIVSIHLWFEREFMPQDAVGIIGRRIQWLFKKKAGHVSAVISAARDFVDRPNEELIAMAHSDVRAVYGPVVGFHTHAVVIREKRATFSATPAMERLRPGAATTVDNLFLAGDWTATGLPATIEGAVMSGERCAARVIPRSRVDFVP